LDGELRESSVALHHPWDINRYPADYLARMEKAAQRYGTWIKNAPGHIATMREFMEQSKSQVAKAA
jgi:hypothetical protein